MSQVYPKFALQSHLRVEKESLCSLFHGIQDYQFRQVPSHVQLSKIIVGEKKHEVARAAVEFSMQRLQLNLHSVLCKVPSLNRAKYACLISRSRSNVWF